jgi:hypothetical protein
MRCSLPVWADLARSRCARPHLLTLEGLHPGRDHPTRVSRVIALVLARLTIGLRKADGRWAVTHEHHSFADATHKESLA